LNYPHFPHANKQQDSSLKKELLFIEKKECGFRFVFFLYFCDVR
jgi:hypothetical protein